MLQDEKPVYFASKALIEAQQGYVAIELESFAVAWAMEKFHHFLYENQFILETDQKPLETILARSLNQATPRLQHILIRIMTYNFKVHYLKGLKNQLADWLSRVGGLQDSIKLPNLSVYQITSQIMQEVTACSNYVKFYKWMTLLLYLSIQYKRGGQALSKNSQVRSNHTRHSGRK